MSESHAMEVDLTMNGKTTSALGSRSWMTITSRLMSGFDSMTLDPSARLRLTRIRLQRKNYYVEARKLLSEVQAEIWHR